MQRGEGRADRKTAQRRPARGGKEERVAARGGAKNMPPEGRRGSAVDSRMKCAEGPRLASGSGGQIVSKRRGKGMLPTRGDRR